MNVRLHPNEIKKIQEFQPQGRREEIIVNRCKLRNENGTCPCEHVVLCSVLRTLDKRK